jgi:surface protein
MFYQCISLEKLNIDNFDTINVKDMKGIFCECIKLKEIKLNGLNLNNIKNMDNMFGLLPTDL